MLFCLHSDTARLLNPFLFFLESTMFSVFPFVYNVLITSNCFCKESNTLCFSTFRNQNRVALQRLNQLRCIWQIYELCESIELIEYTRSRLTW